jgi:hypothetical protein
LALYPVDTRELSVAAEGHQTLVTIPEKEIRSAQVVYTIVTARD